MLVSMSQLSQSSNFWDATDRSPATNMCFFNETMWHVGFTKDAGLRFIFVAQLQIQEPIWTIHSLGEYNGE
jgi:hypothetical protein